MILELNIIAVISIWYPRFGAGAVVDDRVRLSLFVVEFPNKSWACIVLAEVRESPCKSGVLQGARRLHTCIFEFPCERFLDNFFLNESSNVGILFVRVRSISFSLPIDRRINIVAMENHVNAFLWNQTVLFHPFCEVCLVSQHTSEGRVDIHIR